MTDLPDWATDPKALDEWRKETSRLAEIEQANIAAEMTAKQAEYIPVTRHTTWLDSRGKPYEVEYTEYVKKETS